MDFDRIFFRKTPPGGHRFFQIFPKIDIEYHWTYIYPSAKFQTDLKTREHKVAGIWHLLPTKLSTN